MDKEIGSFHEPGNAGGVGELEKARKHFSPGVRGRNAALQMPWF